MCSDVLMLTLYLDAKIGNLLVISSINFKLRCCSIQTVKKLVKLTRSCLIMQGYKLKHILHQACLSQQQTNQIMEVKTHYSGVHCLC